MLNQFRQERKNINMKFMTTTKVSKKSHVVTVHEEKKQFKKIISFWKSTSVNNGILLPKLF